MIRIKPYTELPNASEILTCYLNLVADAVPFRPEDVLWGVEMAPDSRSRIPRSRAQKKSKKNGEEKKSPAYVALLNAYQVDQTKSLRDQDAILAQKIIQAYSTELHNKLYTNPTRKKPGAVNREALRRLLTTTFPHGKVPNDLRFSEHPSGTAALLRDNVFRYGIFSQKRPEGKRSVYQLLSMLSVSVCPYCNRQYITTVAHGRHNVRPQFDHFHNKKDFPYLALSINNLVPCCGVCNLLKSDETDQILYPYDEEMGDRFVFQARYIEHQSGGRKTRDADFVSLLQNMEADARRLDLLSGENTENCDGVHIITSLLQGANDAMGTFRITLEESGENHDDDFVKHAKNSLSVLALEELYQSHKDYVADLFFQRYIFTEDYFASTATQFKKLFKSVDDVKHTLRLMDYSPGVWGNRPLAKLTHDIAEQIDKLYIEND